MKSTCKNYIIWAVVLMSVSVMSCTDRDVTIVGVAGGNFPISTTDFEASAPFSFEVPIGNRGQVRVQGINGRITITGTSGANSVMITGIKRVGSDSLQDAEDHLAELHVTVKSLTDEVFVETIQPHTTEGRHYLVDYTISLPKDVEVQVTHINGIVTLDSIEHDVTVHSENGEVTLIGIVGSARVNVVNGTIEGDITLPVHGTIDLKTVNGNINLALPVNTSAAFSARVSSGSVSMSDLVLQHEVSTSTSLSGTLGNGHGTISLTTRNGNIRVSGF